MRQAGQQTALPATTVRAKQSTGESEREQLSALQAIGVLNDQSSGGSDPVLSSTRAQAPKQIEHTIHVGDVSVWTGRMWAPRSPKACVPEVYKSDASDTPTTTASATYQQAATQNVILPPGNWTIAVTGLLRAIRASSPTVNLRLVIDSVADASPSTVDVDTTIYTEISTNYKASGVRGGRAVTVTLQYKGGSGSGITTSSKAPRIFIVPGLEL